MDKIFFDTWESLLRTFIITILSYIALVAMLRISGKRTLTQMNAFDFIITIALGSAFATVTLNKDVVLADGLLVLALLILLQYIITWLSVRYKYVNNLITNKPALLAYNGNIYDDTLIKERITYDELEEALRKSGITDISGTRAVILETAGNITVITK
ncbi:DUF421 domain-containing protein [Flavobacterium sp. NRK1]|uniref:DUF421 domain-containing protein n=1 Tax=Flavobacterium sp. NRK1 TaxID=2954929 RepID=UPI002093BAC8|nr:YetF domain-containing protein [Flavobacterium sp. NRK1]MCO6149427.1 DUF421 domain-containing protein [Flavobacterium sp. NRK1]